MADAVQGPDILQENDKRVVIKIVNESDGNGGTTVFGDVSALAANAAGASVAHLNLQRIWFSCQGGDGGDTYARLDEEDDDGDEASINNTFVNAGASLVFGDFQVDGLIGTSDQASTSVSGTSTEGGNGTLRTDALLSRVSMLYRF